MKARSYLKIAFSFLFCSFCMKNRVTLSLLLLGRRPMKRLRVIHKPNKHSKDSQVKVDQGKKQGWEFPINSSIFSQSRSWRQRRPPGFRPNYRHGSCLMRSITAQPIQYSTVVSWHEITILTIKTSLAQIIWNDFGIWSLHSTIIALFWCKF